MKLVFAIVSDEDSSRLISELNKLGHRVTRLNTTGGFLRSGNTTLMSGIADDKQDEVLATIRKYSSSRKVSINANTLSTGMGGSFIPYPVEVQIGGATVFVVPVDHYEKV